MILGVIEGPAIEQYGLMGLLATLIGTLVWVFRTAIPKMQDDHRTDMNSMNTRLENLMGVMNARSESMMKMILEESKTNRQFLAEEMEKRDQALNLMGTRIDTLAKDIHNHHNHFDKGLIG